MRESAEFHALGGFLIQVRGFFGVVGIDGHNHAAAGHQRGIVGNRVIGFDLVSPPIGKSGRTNAGSSQFIGNFITLENVLKSADFETKFFRDPQEHQNFILAIAVRVHVALAFEHFDERFESQIAARRNEILFAGSGSLVVVLPGFLIVARLAERGANCLFDPHARRRITLGLPWDAEVRTLGIFAERELDAGKRALERQLGRGLAPAQLDDQRLPADGIGGPVQNVRRSYAARQVAINVNVVRIQNLGHVHDRRDGNTALVNALRRNVRMAINNAGDDELPRGVNDLCIFRRLDGLADFRDFAIFNEDGAVLNRSVRNSENGGILNDDDGGRVRRRGGVRQRHAKETNEVEERKESEVPSSDEEFRRALHWASPSTAVVLDELPVGFTPVNSREKLCTLMLPFSEVPSNVPEKVTSAGEPSIGRLMVKLNLSTLKYPLMIEAVPRVLATVPEIVPSFSMVRSAVDSSGPSGVV